MAWPSDKLAKMRYCVFGYRILCSSLYVRPAKIYYNVYSLLPLTAFQCLGEQTDEECFDQDCQPQMTCSQPVILNYCPVNFTVNVNLETDVFIYQRNTSDDFTRLCSSSGKDCLVDHTETLTYTVTHVRT